MNIILASSSISRQKQLQQLTLNFTAIAPNVDESPLPNEKAENLVIRLAKDKALTIAQTEKCSIIIAGDQVCLANDTIVGKPESMTAAVKQLQACSGKTIRFYSGLAVYNTDTQEMKTAMIFTDVSFRTLQTSTIESYVERAKPLYCAGSFNLEGLGIGLFEKIDSDDPTALIGLPLIALTSFLNENGISVL